MEVARLVNDEENDCRFEVQMEEHWIHTPTYMVNSCQGKLLELFCDLTGLMLQCSGIGCDTSS